MKTKQRRLAHRSVLFTGLEVGRAGGSVSVAQAPSGTFSERLMTIGWSFRSRRRHVATHMVPGVSKSASEVREAPAAPAGSLRWLPPRWRSFWRSPDDQPRWARPVLLGIAAFAALLYSWNIANVGYATFYPVAVKSMSVSWQAFVYGALDPGATVTIDKLAGSFLPQALSARVFGFHSWSLALPQVIEGVVSVLVMYRVVRRWAGPAAGLLAAGIFTLTPILASMFGHPMEDGMLTMCLVLAADAVQRAVAGARLRSLALAGVWVGIGFQAKMLEAWMVLPAFVVTYLVVAPAGWWRRLVQVTVAGAVMLAVSLSWVLLFAVTPAHDRPYADGSTNNSAFAMVFGYNGLDRFGVHVPGAAHSIVGGGGPSRAGQVPAGLLEQGTPGSRGPFGGGGPGALAGGWVKLFRGTYGTQVGWLYPLALLALALGLVRAGRAPRTDPFRGGLILWGGWLLTFGVVYSKMTLPHTAYVAALAPPLAALSAAGIVMSWKAYRDGTAVWALPAAITAEAAWSVYLSSRYPTFLPWLIWIATAVAAVSLAVLIAAKPRVQVRSAVLLGGMVAGVAAMVAVPGAWSASVLDPAYSGTSFDASAGPGGGISGRAVGAVPSPGKAGGGLPGGFPGGLPGGVIAPRGGRGAGVSMAGSDTLDAPERRLDTYLTKHRDGAEFVAATDSWRTAATYIMATGQAFMPMGGFSGEIPHPTLTEVRQLVNGGQLRYFLLGPSGTFSLAQLPGAVSATSTTSEVIAWVKASCTKVAAADYGDSASTGTVYRCSPSS
jgi:4-amino-4-deoxy-L-arabinose transferase-like glycosyltransferase